MFCRHVPQVRNPPKVSRKGHKPCYAVRPQWRMRRGIFLIDGRNKSRACLAALLALASLAAAAEQAAPQRQDNLGELREWLNRRNQERKQLGTAVPEIPKHRHASATPPLAKTQPNEAAIPAQPSPNIGRGPDGRIHHRLVINEQGPDQLQVYSGSGYAPATPDKQAQEDDAHWARLTPRGRQVWMSGKSLREPPPHLKNQR